MRAATNREAFLYASRASFAKSPCGDRGRQRNGQPPRVLPLALEVLERRGADCAPSMGACANLRCSDALESAGDVARSLARSAEIGWACQWRGLSMQRREFIVGL